MRMELIKKTAAQAVDTLGTIRQLTEEERLEALRLLDGAKLLFGDDLDHEEEPEDDLDGVVGKF